MKAMTPKQLEKIVETAVIETTGLEGSCTAANLAFISLATDCGWEIERWGTVYHEWLVVDGEVIDPTAGQFDLDDGEELEDYGDEEREEMPLDPCLDSQTAAASSAIIERAAQIMAAK